MKKLIILLIIAAVITTIVFVAKGVIQDIDKVTNVEEKYLQVEISKELTSMLSTKLLEASNEIQSNKNDLSSAYNETRLIEGYLVSGEFIKPEKDSKQIASFDGGSMVYKVYYINVDKFSEEDHLYGNGTNLNSGDVFTLEPKVQILEDGTEKSTGVYELKYYNSEKKAEVIEEIELYATNKT